MTDTDQPHARLFDYFIACGLQQKQSYNNSNNKHHRNHRRKKLSPNSPDIPWQPVILYVYNANKIVSSSTSSTSPMTPTTPLSPSTPFSEQNIDHQLTEKEKLEESEVLLQVPRYCYCDLSDLINRYNSNNLKISKYNDNNKSSTHNVQFEKFSFVFRRSDGHQMYGHCRRILQQDLLPSSLCIVSSYNFTKLFEQIMDNIITKWIFDDHNSIFIFLNNILTYNNCIPPSIGDTFRVSLNDNNCPNNLYQNKSTNSSQDELNNMITLKLESTNRQNLKILFKRLSIDNILFLISCILTEQKLIFISSKLEILSECIYGLVSLIYPFKWQYLLCPILTEKYLNFFTTPLPFIIGIKRYLANYYRSIDKKKSNIVVIDLDKQNILSSTRKFKHLPNKPCWKLKRELNRIIKKFEYLMYDINDFKISIQQNTMNNKYRYIPSNDIIKTGKNKDKQNKQNMKKTKKHRRKPSESSTNLRLLLQKEMTYDIAKGWDDTPFYNAFLSFFIVFIGDWKKFYDEKNPLTPKTPYHLKNIKKNKKKLQQNDKNDKNYGLKQIFYSQEALEYLDKLLQTQLFQTWYIRQRKESQNGEIKLYGVQDIYDFALKNSDKFGGLSYTGCYDYLSITFNSLNKKLVKYVIDTVFEFTENTDCTRNTNMIDLMISCASSEPYTFNSIINIINYRLYNILDNNYQNHSFALMSFYLLMKLMEQSTEKIIMHCIDKYIYFAFILNKYYINDNNVIKKQMKHITNKFIQLTTNINELKRIRSNNNNNNNTTNSPKPILNLLDLFQWNQENDDKESHIVATNVKLSVIAFKLSTYDFSDLHMETMDHDEKLLLLNQVMTPPKNIHSYHIFTKMSQYQPINAQEYRKRATKQEVNVIPPFIHLHQQFAIDIDIDQNSFIQETKQDNDEYQHDNDDNVSFQRLHQVAPINSNTHNIMSPEIDVISPRKHATASIWELPHVDIPKQHSHALQESTSISIQSLTPTPPPNNSNYKSIDMNLDELNNLAIDGSLTNIKKTRKKKKKRSNSRKKEKREKKEKKEKKKIITPPMINVDLNNTAKKVKWVIDTKHDVEEQDDMEYEYEPSADSTELDMTPQPTEPYYMIDKFKNPNNSKHVIQGSDPEQSYDVMTLGSGDDANEEVVDDLEHIPITKFNDDGISVKSYKSAKTSKWEEESLDLDSIRGNSLSRHSMHEQAQHLSQQSSLNKHESSPLDIADDNNEHEHKQNEHVIEDNDDKVNMNININISDEYSHKQHNTQTTTLTHVSCDSSPIDVNMSPPNIMFQQKSAQKRPRRTINNKNHNNNHKRKSTNNLSPHNYSSDDEDNEIKRYNISIDNHDLANLDNIMVDTDDDDDDENDDTQYIIPPELHGSDPNEKLGASSSEDTYNDEEIVADLNEILSPNGNDKLLLVHNSNNSASSSHQKSGLSRASTKSVLTMDFDINDLSVAPDYEFREKSPRFGASLAPESPEKQPISPLSALPPSVNGTSIIDTKRFSRKKKSSKSKSSKSKNYGDRNRGDRTHGDSPSSPALSNLSKSHSGNKILLNGRKKAKSAASVAESCTSDVDVDEFGAKAEIQTQITLNEAEEPQDDTNMLSSISTISHHEDENENENEDNKINVPKINVTNVLNNPVTPSDDSDDSDESNNNDNHDTDSDSSSGMTIELVPGNDECEDDDDDNDDDIDKLLDANESVIDDETILSEEPIYKYKHLKQHQNGYGYGYGNGNRSGPGHHNNHKRVLSSSSPASFGNNYVNHYNFNLNKKRGSSIKNNNNANNHNFRDESGALSLDNEPSGQESVDSGISHPTIQISEMTLSDDDKQDGTEYSFADTDPDYYGNLSFKNKKRKSVKSSKSSKSNKNNKSNNKNNNNSPKKGNTIPPPADNLNPVPYIINENKASGANVITPINTMKRTDTDNNKPIPFVDQNFDYNSDPYGSNLDSDDIRFSKHKQRRKGSARSNRNNNNNNNNTNKTSKSSPSTPKRVKRKISNNNHNSNNNNNHHKSKNHGSHHRHHHNSHSHHQHRKKKKRINRMTEDEFSEESLEEFIKSGGDDFDIAKRICKWFDKKFGDTDTVAIVADKGKGPKLSYWSKANYQRKDKNLSGKYVFVYRACKHIEAKCVIKKEKFEKFVRDLAMEYKKPHEIADRLDSKFGEGCHVARAKHDQFDVYCRYSNGYMSDILLPNGDFIVAWRR